MFTVNGIAKLFHMLCLSVRGPRIRCQFAVVISLFLAALTDGETLGRLPLKGVINRTCESVASALTPCQGCLLGPRSRGQCLPFTPRYSRSLPWPFPAGKHTTPWDSKPISTPLPSSPTPRNPYLFASFPFFLRPNKLPLQLSQTLSLSGIVVSGPVIVLHSISQRCLRSGDFALNHSSGNWCVLEENVCAFKTWRKERALWKSCLSCH